jgi:hypothetical protein
MIPYVLNGKDLASYGVIAGLAQDSDIAISGFCDMPSRIGKVYHDWADENGLEPYLRADEIFFGGRDILFYGLIAADSEEEGQQIINNILFDINAFNGLVPFNTEFGNWMVYVSTEVKVTYQSQGCYTFVLTLRQPIVNLSGIIPSGAIADFGIDALAFDVDGFVLMKTADSLNRPAGKSFEQTAYGFEAYRASKHSFRQFNLQFLLYKDDYPAFDAAVKSLYALFASPGARTISMYDGTKRECFIKDGFRVTGIRRMDGLFTGVIDLSITEIRMLEVWNKLTTKLGDILVDKNGIPLTEILKKF